MDAQFKPFEMNFKKMIASTGDSLGNSNFEGDKFFARLADASPCAIWLLNTEGTVIHANGQAVRSPAIPKFKNGGLWRDIWPETIRFSVDRPLEEARNGQSVSFRIRCPLEGRHHAYLKTTISPVCDDDGRLVRLWVRADDVTADIESSAFLNTVFETLPTALTVRDARSGRYILANRAAEDLLKHKDGLIGLRSEDVLPQPFAAWETCEDVFPSRLQSAVSAEADLVDSRHLSAVKVATYDDDGVRHVISLIEDVTKQRHDEAALRNALEQARKAGHARSVFLGNISHELRTPLNGVIAGIDLMQTSVDDRAEVLDMVRRSATALERLLADLMRVVHLDAPEEAVDVGPIYPAALLQDLAERFQARASAKGLPLVVETSVCAPLSGSRVCIEEALSPLIDNAIKFSRMGMIVLSAETLTDGQTRFSVTDDGIGFDLGQKEHLFDSFEKGDDSLIRPFGGLGLGLAIADKAARRMGGAIDALPRPEGGARFWLDIPPTLALPAQAATDSENHRLSVLIADDHPSNRRIVELMLEKLAAVRSVADGLEAVEVAARESFDLILMDIQMPRLDGVSAVARIRAAEIASGRRPTPIIMLTANTQVEYLKACQAAGADHHIGKPFTADALLNGIQTVLNIPSGQDHSTQSEPGNRAPRKQLRDS